MNESDIAKAHKARWAAAVKEHGSVHNVPHDEHWAILEAHRQDWVAYLGKDKPLPKRKVKVGEEQEQEPEEAEEADDREMQNMAKRGTLTPTRMEILRSDTYHAMSEEFAAYRKEHGPLKIANQTLARELTDAERKLKARDKQLQEMLDNHTQMRESLISIRRLHMPTEETYNPEDNVPCGECGQPWPCPTYIKIRTPEHLVVTRLLRMQTELTKEE